MKNLLTEIGKLIIGGSVFLLLFIVGVVYTFLKHLVKFDYSLSKQLSPVIRSILLLFDGLANAGSGELFNDLLKVSKNAKIRYGKWYQTISAVTGLRKVCDEIDNRFRTTLDKVLGRNHCIDAISDEDLYYYQDHK